MKILAIKDPEERVQYERLLTYIQNCLSVWVRVMILIYHSIFQRFRTRCRPLVHSI